MNINGCSNGTHVLMDSFQKIIRTIRKAVVLSLGRGRSPLRYFGAVDQTFDVLLREDQNGRIHGHSDSKLRSCHLDLLLVGNHGSPSMTTARAHRDHTCRPCALHNI